MYMASEFWKKRLTPFDWELCMMVESLTGKPCEPKNGGINKYFISVDYSKRSDADFVSALIDAVCGRLGDRVVTLEDYPDLQQFVVHVKFSGQRYPGIMRTERNHKPNPSKGLVYCRSLAEIRAVQVKRGNMDRLLAFVGNGEMEIPDDGPAIFHFRNTAGDVWQHAYEFDYIVFVSDGRFDVVRKDDFERDYEPK